MDRGQTAFRVIRAIRYISLAITFVLFALIITLARQSARDIFRWLGWGIGISGLSLLILSLLLGPIASLIRDQTFTDYAEFVQSGSLVVDLVNQILDAGAGYLMWTSVVVLVIGIIMIILSYILKGPAAPQAPPTQ